MPEIKLLTLHEVASETGYLADTLRQLANKGKIPSVKMGRDWFIDAKDLGLIKERRKKYSANSKLKSIFREGK